WKSLSKAAEYALSLHDALPILKPRSITWHWELMFTRPTQQTPDMAEQHRMLTEVSRLTDAGKVRPTTTETLSPISRETLRQAHERIENNRTVGKIVLDGWE